MPIVDGLTSTKMIRAFEQDQRASGLLTTAHRGHRIPIIAVSASLVEREKDTYVGAGFDGWILKPIDFKRLETLLRGIVDDQTREESLYVPGYWEKGGWFHRRTSPVVRQGKVEQGGGVGRGTDSEPPSGLPVGLGLGLKLGEDLGKGVLRVPEPWQTDGVDDGRTIPEMVDPSRAKGIVAPATTSLLPLIQSQSQPVTGHQKSASSASASAKISNSLETTTTPTTASALG